MPPTAIQRRLALLLASALLVGLVVVLPFSNVQLARLPAFAVACDTTLFLVGTITAALLYAHYSVARSRGLLALAFGYLLGALLAVGHLLTFPGAAAPAGLLGADIDSAVWLYVFWHLTLPLAAIAYALLEKAPATTREYGVRAAVPIALSIAAAGLAAVLLIWFATAGSQWLPSLMVDAMVPVPGSRIVMTLLAIGVGCGALALIARRRSSVLDLWLMVVICGWLVDAVLLALAPGRFSLVWYLGKAVGIICSCIVLLVLLSESTILYARLALALAARDREREGKRLSLETTVTSIALDLNQPLTAIVANADAGTRLLEQSPPDVDEARVALGEIADDALRASQTVDAVRTMVSDRSAQPVLVDMGQLVRETVALLSPDLESRGVRLEVHSPVAVSPVRGNKAQLLQLLLNLVSNAGGSMTADGGTTRCLRIRYAAESASGVALSVEDPGGCIDSGDAARSFESLANPRELRAGLELAICRAIVESHGGRMSARPGAQGGAEFRVVLPAA